MGTRASGLYAQLTASASRQRHPPRGAPEAPRHMGNEGGRSVNGDELKRDTKKHEARAAASATAAARGVAAGGPRGAGAGSG
jgi:hypothetical protein